MKRFLIIIIFLLTYSLSKSDTWTQKANYPGTRRGAFAFSIGTKGYVGCGQIASAQPLTQDFWEYDPATNIWTQKADFGGGLRILATGFSTLGKGYAGLGVAATPCQDLWEYDPLTNVWTQKANFGGGLRGYPVSFATDSLGYVGTGYNFTPLLTVYNDLWEYNPLTNIWTQKSNLPGAARSDAVGFLIGDKGYIGTGATATVGGLKDFWEYDILTDSWVQKTDLPGLGFCDAAGFSIGNSGFIGTGERLPICCHFIDTFYEYNVALNQWLQKANFAGTARDEGIGFSIGNSGYMGLGGHNGSPSYSDFWEYRPDSTTHINEISQNKISINISPNPNKGVFNISYLLPQNKDGKLEMFDINGRKVYSLRLPQWSTLQMVNLPELSEGLYQCVITSDNMRVSKKVAVMKE